VYFASIHLQRDAAQYFPIAYSCVKIIYFEHETTD